MSFRHVLVAAALLFAATLLATDAQAQGFHGLSHPIGMHGSGMAGLSHPITPNFHPYPHPHPYHPWPHPHVYPYPYPYPYNPYYNPYVYPYYPYSPYYPPYYPPGPYYGKGAPASAGVKPAPETIHPLFNKLDTDGDGLISHPEFHQGIPKYQLTK